MISVYVSKWLRPAESLQGCSIYAILGTGAYGRKSLATVNAHMYMLTGLFSK